MFVRTGTADTSSIGAGVQARKGVFPFGARTQTTVVSRRGPLQMLTSPTIPTWSAGSYARGAMVQSAGKLYMAVNANSDNTLNTRNWNEVELKWL